MEKICAVCGQKAEIVTSPVTGNEYCVNCGAAQQINRLNSLNHSNGSNGSETRQCLALAQAHFIIAGRHLKRAERKRQGPGASSQGLENAG